jgi:hypothetical protein
MSIRATANHITSNVATIKARYKNSNGGNRVFIQNSTRPSSWEMQNLGFSRRT